MTMRLRVAKTARLVLAIAGAMCAPLTPGPALAEIKISGARMALPDQ